VLDKNRPVLTLDGNDSSGGVVIAVQFGEDVARGAEVGTDRRDCLAESTPPR
jgi:hypothetical protein